MSLHYGSHRISNLDDITRMDSLFQLSTLSAKNIDGKAEANQIQQGLKSEVEIQSHIIDENLSPYARQQLYWFGKSSNHQLKISGINRMLFDIDDERAHKQNDIVQQLIPHIHTALPQLVNIPSLLSLLSQLHIDIIQKSLLTLKEAETWTNTIIGILDNEELTDATLQAWLPVLLALLPVLATGKPQIKQDKLQGGANQPVATPLSPVLHSQVLPFTSKKSGFNQPPLQRYMSVLLWCDLSFYLPLTLLESECFPAMRPLCQDTSSMVRLAICEKLSLLLQRASTQTINDFIVELEELMKDEEKSIRSQSFQTIVQFLYLPSLSVETRKSKLIPLFRSYIQVPPKGMLLQIAQHFGELLHLIQNDIKQDLHTSRAFLAFYKNLILQTEIEPRKWCAFNFPAVTAWIANMAVLNNKDAKTASNERANAFVEHLNNIYIKLIKDEDEEVRHIMVSSFLTIVSLLGNSAFKLTKDALLYLLHDRSPSIVHQLFTQLTSIFLEYICPGTYPVSLPPLSFLSTPATSHLSSLSNDDEAEEADKDKGVGLTYQQWKQSFLENMKFVNALQLQLPDHLVDTNNPSSSALASLQSELLRIFHKLYETHTLTQMIPSGSAPANALLNTFLPASSSAPLSTCTQSFNWRSKVEFVSKFQFIFPILFSRLDLMKTPADVANFQFVCDKIIPITISQMHCSIAPIKSASIQFFITFLLSCPLTFKKLELIGRITKEFQNSRSYHDRLVYVDFLSFMLSHFSGRFIRRHFLPSSFLLAQDAVPQIRRKYAALICSLRKVAKGDMVDTLNKQMETLKSDRDREVVDIIKRISSEYSGIASRHDYVNEDHEREVAEDAAVQVEEEWLGNEKNKHALTMAGFNVTVVLQGLSLAQQQSYQPATKPVNSKRSSYGATGDKKEGGMAALLKSMQEQGGEGKRKSLNKDKDTTSTSTTTTSSSTAAPLTKPLVKTKSKTGATASTPTAAATANSSTPTAASAAAISQPAGSKPIARRVISSAAATPSASNAPKHPLPSHSDDVKTDNRNKLNDHLTTISSSSSSSSNSTASSSSSTLAAPASTTLRAGSAGPNRAVNPVVTRSKLAGASGLGGAPTINSSGAATPTSGNTNFHTIHNAAARIVAGNLRRALSNNNPEQPNSLPPRSASPLVSFTRNRPVVNRIFNTSNLSSLSNMSSNIASGSVSDRSNDRDSNNNSPVTLQGSHMHHGLPHAHSTASASNASSMALAGSMQDANRRAIINNNNTRGNLTHASNATVLPKLNGGNHNNTTTPTEASSSSNSSAAPAAPNQAPLKLYSKEPLAHAHMRKFKLAQKSGAGSLPSNDMLKEEMERASRANYEPLILPLDTVSPRHNTGNLPSGRRPLAIGGLGSFTGIRP